METFIVIAVVAFLITLLSILYALRTIAWNLKYLVIEVRKMNASSRSNKWL